MSGSKNPPPGDGDVVAVRRLVGLPSLSTAWTVTVVPGLPDGPPDGEQRQRDATYDSLEIQEQPRHDGIAAFAALWHAKRRDDLLPARSDFPIEELQRWFGHVLIMDVGPDAADFRYRMIGTDVTAFRDRDYTGKWISECSFGESRESMVATFRNPVVRRRPVFRYGWVQWPVDGSWRSFDSVHCPLASDGRTVDMTIGVLYFDAFPPPGLEE